MSSNITDPACDSLLALWNDPIEYASIQVEPVSVYILFTVVVESPDSPRLEIPIHAIPGGHC